MRVLDVDDAARLVAARHGDCPRLVVGGNAAVPWRLLRALDSQLARYRLFMLNAPAGVPDREGVVLETPFVGPGMRSRSALDYHPARLSLVPRLIHDVTPPDVVCVSAAPPREGHLSLGVEVNILPAAIEAAHRRGGTVIASINRHMPFTYGDAELPVEAVDLAVEVEEPLVELHPRPTSEISGAIAERVAALVPSGATLQTGIGAVPDQVMSALTARRGLRFWTEMLSDGVLQLARAGSLDPDAPLVASFLFGSRSLYDWAERNPRLHMLRTETVNDPGHIARRPQMTSVNTALEVDLYAQANASYVRGRIHSGFGGQSDFVVGALHSDGGSALIALPSWHDRADVSTMVPVLSVPATSFQATAVVTEQGVARLWGASQHEQARRLVEQAAHLRSRAELTEARDRLALA